VLHWTLIPRPREKHRAPASCGADSNHFRAYRDERLQRHKRRAAPSSSTLRTTASTSRPVESITQAPAQVSTGHLTGLVPYVPLGYLARKAEGYIGPLVFKRLCAAQGPLLEGRCQEYLKVRPGKTTVAHIPAVGTSPGDMAKAL